MKQHDTRRSITFSMTQSEFHLLASLMAPLRFDESEGHSIWVSGRPNGGRAWIASADDITSVVEVASDGTMVDVDEGWSFPIPEDMLVTIGKVFMNFDEAIITLTTTKAFLETEEISISMCQNPYAARPAIPPMTHATCSATIDASNLWTVLNAARLWPTGGKGDFMNPPMRCTFDIASGRLRFDVDWSYVGLEEYNHTIAAEFGAPAPGTIAPTFNFPHSAVLSILRDPMTCHRMGTITLHASPAFDGESHMLLEGENWKLYVPTLPNVSHWGQDLDAVIDGIEYEWENCALVKVLSPELDGGAVELSALPEDSGLYKYRVSYDVLDDVIPTVALYNEINNLNECATGCRLVVDGSRVKAVCDLTQENYKNLGSHVKAFVSTVNDLPPLLSAISGMN